VINQIEGVPGDRIAGIYGKAGSPARLETILEMVEEVKLREGVDLFLSVGGPNPIDATKRMDLTDLGGPDVVVIHELQKKAGGGVFTACYGADNVYVSWVPIQRNVTKRRNNSNRVLYEGKG
jgi:hypothetical protein